MYIIICQREHWSSHAFDACSAYFKSRGGQNGRGAMGRLQKGGKRENASGNVHLTTQTLNIGRNSDTSYRAFLAEWASLKSKIWSIINPAMLTFLNPRECFLPWLLTIMPHGKNFKNPKIFCNTKLLSRWSTAGCFIGGYQEASKNGSKSLDLESLVPGLLKVHLH